ncbi:MAG: alpha-amylase family glycosyl hydrolase [Terriglobia bacterium]|nr:alpha-amylase family glycosyl hydrolase [Terriglobia bacterium]
MSRLPTFEFHVSRDARERYGFADALFTISGNVVFADLNAAREFAHRVNVIRDAERNPEKAMHPGALNAMGLIDEALHAVLHVYREQLDPGVMVDALSFFQSRLGEEQLDRTLLAFADHFPTVDVFRGKISVREWLNASTGRTPHRAIALEELAMLWLANQNPAFKPFDELFKDDQLAQTTSYKELTSTLRSYFDTRPKFEQQNLLDVLRAPALASPDSLAGQLAFIQEKWKNMLGESLRRFLTALDVLQEEEKAIWMRFHPPSHEHFGGGVTLGGDSSAAAIPRLGMGGDHEYEAFSPDVDWMPKTVMMAKTVYVWLDQLSRQYQRGIHRLDEIPDEELDLLARRGFNALWLIGLWERSKASRNIKVMCGNPEAAASAYSLADYVIAADLGGDGAYHSLRERATRRGIRLASDMVPNHMGIDSRWVIQHPDWFLSLPHSPYPGYRFEGPDLSSDGRVEIKIEDHYYNRTDAAVVFRRIDRWTGDTRYVYHGNDGTSFPWNDTAQLNYLDPAVREAVIQTILHVARMFPIIRFDAAMTLAKKHYQRLWFPEPGTGGAIPSRAEHGMTRAEFDATFPQEFWREVVDRVAQEVPGTLLLAEAFWLMEGYFVRTLGMHRVYNSAFMNMLRDEENANYRSVIKNTLEFDPDVLKRYVNFMNNPDEKTAVEQFGKGDKYFGVCTLMATLPGLPMFGHGQMEGYGEKYGMEYRRAYYDERPDSWLVARHEREISPLLHRRALFAEVRDFLFYDFYTDDGWVDENVFAYSNRLGDERALVVYHNKFSSTRGWVRISCGYAEKTGDGGKRTRQKTLGECFGLSGDGAMYVAFRDAASGLEFLHRQRDLTERGLHLSLDAYKTHVFLEWRDIRDDGTRPWGLLCESLNGRGVSSLDDALRALELKPVHDAVVAMLDSRLVRSFAECAVKVPVPKEIPKSGKRTKELVTPPTDGNREQTFSALQHLFGVFLAEVKRLAATPTGESAGLKLAREWSDGKVQPAELFIEQITAALRLPSVIAGIDSSLSSQAKVVLPAAGESIEQALPRWGAVLAWAALEIIGTAQNAESPCVSAVAVFDALRLREPIAEALAKMGMQGEDRWRSAARIRASFAHEAWCPAPVKTSGMPPATLSWEHDPDVAWLLGVHEYEGVRYFNKESFEQLTWWSTLPKLLEIAAGESAVPELAKLEEQVRERFRAASEGGYRVESLLDSARQSTDSDAPRKL